jgi:hypothetical protein
VSEQNLNTIPAAPPLRLLRKLRRLAAAVGALPLRWSTEGKPEDRFEYLASSDLEAALRPALHALNLSVTTPSVEVRVAQVIGRGDVIAEARVSLRVVDLTSGEAETWTAMGLCDGSAATASGGAVTVARKAVWIGALNCRSAKDAEGHPAAPIDTGDPWAADKLRASAVHGAYVAAIREGREAGVWEGDTPAVQKQVRDAVAEWLEAEGISSGKLTDLSEDRFAAVLAFAKTGKWGG